MHKTLLILTLLSIGSIHSTAAETDALKLYPVTEPTKGGDCVFQLKDEKNPEIVHFIQRGICYSHSRGVPLDVKDCTATSVININNNQMTLRRTSLGGLSSALYGNDDYVVEMEFKDRDCEKVSCDPFMYDAELTIEKNSLRQTFDMLGNCEFGEEG